MFKKIISKIRTFLHIHSHGFGCCLTCAHRDSPNGKNKDGGKHHHIDYGYIRTGKNYIKNFERACFVNRRDSLLGIPRELIHAHTLLLGIVGGMLEENSDKPVPNEKQGSAISRRFVLTAAFIQGISLCEQSILQACYLQAGNLIRQEFEALGQLAEIAKNERKDGKSFNAKHAPWNARKHYGELSTIAHLSDHKTLESIIGYNNTWGDFAATVPQYRKDMAIKFYGFHVSMILELVYELKYLYNEIYNYEADEKENDVIANVVGILTQLKVFKS